MWDLQNWTCSQCSHPFLLPASDLCGKVTYNMAQRLRSAGAHVDHATERAPHGVDSYFYNDGGYWLPNSGYRDPMCANPVIMQASPQPSPFIGLEGFPLEDELMFIHVDHSPLPPAPPMPPPVPPHIPPPIFPPSPMPPPFPPNYHQCVDLIETWRCQMKAARGRCGTQYNSRNCMLTCGHCPPWPPFPPPSIPYMDPPSPSHRRHRGHRRRRRPSRRLRAPRDRRRQARRRRGRAHRRRLRRRHRRRRHRHRRLPCRHRRRRDPLRLRILPVTMRHPRRRHRRRRLLAATAVAVAAAAAASVAAGAAASRAARAVAAAASVPSPPQPNPPPVSSSPPPTAGAAARVVTFETVIGGTVSDFTQGRRESYKARLAATLPGVAATDITLTVAAASIRVTASITVTTSAVADSTMSALNSFTPATLSAALGGETVESITPPTVTAVEATNEGLLASLDNEQIVLIAIIGVVLVLLCIALALCCYCCRSSSSGSTARRKLRSLDVEQRNASAWSTMEEDNYPSTDKSNFGLGSSTPGIEASPRRRSWRRRRRARRHVRAASSTASRRRAARSIARAPQRHATAAQPNPYEPNPFFGGAFDSAFDSAFDVEEDDPRLRRRLSEHLCALVGEGVGEWRVMGLREKCKQAVKFGNSIVRVEGLRPRDEAGFAAWPTSSFTIVHRPPSHSVADKKATGLDVQKRRPRCQCCKGALHR